MAVRSVIHRLLVLLIFVLVFEGLARKWVGGGGLSSLIFFAKDGICLLLWLALTRAQPNKYLRRMVASVAIFSIAFSPLVVITAYEDIGLAIFGAKQYLLWPVVAMAAMAAYIPDRPASWFRLLHYMALLVVPTSLLAIYQQRLPAGHWLNKTPDGSSMEAFSAAGKLRVSGTFSFVSQYCMYLNALCYALPASMSMKSNNPLRSLVKSSGILIVLFLIGTFVTGSRGAVVGNAVILAIGVMVLIICGKGRTTGTVLVLTAFAMLTMLVLRGQFPEFFAAYDARSAAVGETSHTEKLLQRVTTGLFGWTDGMPPRAPASLFGYGLGVMSNGSASICEYAASWRTEAFWTETDQATTLFEGGFYLIFIWYGLRLLMVMQALLWVMQIRRPRFLLPAAFAFSFVAVIGFIGTLAIQPPIAIWWWLAIGSIACLHAFDRAERFGASTGSA